MPEDRTLRVSALSRVEGEGAETTTSGAAAIVGAFTGAPPA